MEAGAIAFSRTPCCRATHLGSFLRLIPTHRPGIHLSLGWWAIALEVGFSAYLALCARVFGRDQMSACAAGAALPLLPSLARSRPQVFAHCLIAFLIIIPAHPPARPPARPQVFCFLYGIAAIFFAFLHNKFM